MRMLILLLASVPFTMMHSIRAFEKSTMLTCHACCSEVVKAALHAGHPLEDVVSMLEDMHCRGWSASSDVYKMALPLIDRQVSSDSALQLFLSCLAPCFLRPFPLALMPASEQANLHLLRGLIRQLLGEISMQC